MNLIMCFLLRENESAFHFMCAMDVFAPRNRALTDVCQHLQVAETEKTHRFSLDLGRGNHFKIRLDVVLFHRLGAWMHEEISFSNPSWLQKMSGNICRILTLSDNRVCVAVHTFSRQVENLRGGAHKSTQSVPDVYEEHDVRIVARLVHEAPEEKSALWFLCCFFSRRWLKRWCAALSWREQSDRTILMFVKKSRRGWSFKWIKQSHRSFDHQVRGGGGLTTSALSFLHLELPHDNWSLVTASFIQNAHPVP